MMLSKLYFGLIFLIFLLPVYVHSAQEVAPKNLFALIPNDCIKVIADNLDEESCRSFGACSRRLFVASWPSEKVFHLTMETGYWERNDEFWKRVLQKLHLLSQCIARAQAHNDVVLHLPTSAAGFLLPDELAHVNNLVGLLMEYRLSGNYFYRQEQEANLEKLLAMLPNLKHLSLPWDYHKPLALMLNQLKKLQTLWVKGCKLESVDLASMPSTIKELQLMYCRIYGIPSMEKFKSLRSLSLLDVMCLQCESEESNAVSFQINKNVKDLEKLLSPLAPFLEKLELEHSVSDTLPPCLASFRNLKELNISKNRLDPASLQCLTHLPKLRLINLARNEQCEAHKDLVRSMFPETVTISYTRT